MFIPPIQKPSVYATHLLTAWQAELLRRQAWAGVRPASCSKRLPLSWLNGPHSSGYQFASYLTHARYPLQNMPFDLPTFSSVSPPPLKLLPTLSVNAKGRVYLSRDLMERLGLRDGQPANLLPPTSEANPCWHLDLRAKARHKVSIYKHSRPRIEFIKLPSGLIQPGQRVRLQLVPGDPEFAGFYPLLPDAFFAPR